MARREALRDFQSRLASRLQAVRTSEISASWLAVESGVSRYLFPLGQAGEIFPWVVPERVPYTQPWFLGVSNLRGGLYGVVHLAAFAGEADPSTATPDSSHAQSRLVALNEALEVNCVLQVDRLVGLRGVEAYLTSEAPAADAPRWHGHGYVDAAGQRWQEINLQALAQQAEFLSIAV